MPDHILHSDIHKPPYDCHPACKQIYYLRRDAALLAHPFRWEGCPHLHHAALRACGNVPGPLLPAAAAPEPHHHLPPPRLPHCCLCQVPQLFHHPLPSPPCRRRCPRQKFDLDNRSPCAMQLNYLGRTEIHVSNLYTAYVEEIVHPPLC